MNSSWSLNIAHAGKPFSLKALLRQSYRHRFQVFLFAFLLLVNLFIFLAYLGPTYRQMLSTGLSLSESRSKISQLLQYTKAQEDLAVVRKTLLKQRDLAKLANLLPEMAKRHRLALPEVNYQIEKDKRDYLKRISLYFDLTGSYAKIRKFIHQAENLDLFLYIEDMSIAGSSRNPSDLTMKIRLVVLLQ